MQTAKNQTDAIADYALGQTESVSTICGRLQKLIEGHLPLCTGRIWHGGPVWFDGENPVVGYDVKVKGVSLLFWNGQAMGDPALKPAGKHGAAEALFSSEDDLDDVTIAAWLCWAGENVFDSVEYFRKQREGR